MPDTPQQIGQYFIEREIGRGGMGVVYLAQDSRLGRSVAVKALPAEVSLDAERLARFEREARTLAQLDHPNLAGIHGVEVHEDRRYLVLEFIEGETLAEVLDRGPLPIDEALDLCAQIAAGVASAHDGGVIHRDLKPANIKITPEGKAKVLDFGLAKSTEPTSSTTNSELPTLTTPRADFQSQTLPGAILGTAPYMSPEQARGRRLDRRSDVWSFGCILYECLTGARLFAGETATDSMGAILHKQIDFALLPAETPTRVRELLARMLERDKDRRLRDLGDAMLELEAAQAEIGTEHAVAESAGKRGPGWAAALVIVALAAAITGAAAYSLRPTTAPITEPAPTRPRFIMSQLTDEAGPEGWPTLSPDGSMMVYTAVDGGDTDIFTRRVDGLNATNLTAEFTGEDYAPALSPDGRLIAFASDHDGGGLYVMGATGESPRRLTDAGADPAWSPDGRRLVYASEQIFVPSVRQTLSELWTVDVESGATERLYAGDAVQPSWSPSGARIAFWRVEASGQRDLFTIAADGSDPIAVTSDAATDWSPVWSPDGRWLYFSSDRGGSMGIWRLAIDDATGVTSGEPEQITTSASAGAGALAFSGDGRRLAFVSALMESDLLRLDLDPQTDAAVGDPRSITPFSSQVIGPSIAPDGRSIAYANIGERQEDLFIMSVEDGRRQRVTNDAAKDRGPEWSGDGKRLVFYSDRDGQYRIWSIRADGGGLELIVESDIGMHTPKLSPDGAYLAAQSRENRSFLCRQNPETGEWTVAPLPAPPVGLKISTSHDWSGDSSKLLVGLLSEEQGQSIPAVLDIDSGEYQAFEGFPSIASARFFSDNRFIAIMADQGVFRLDTETGVTQPIYLFPDGADPPLEFDIAPDDSWLCLSSFRIDSDIWMLEFQEQ